MTKSGTPIKKTKHSRQFRRRDGNLYRSVALKRDPALHVIEEDDLKYYWAAYRTGAFDLPEDLSQEDFTQQVVNLSQVKQVFTMVVGKPVGMVTVDYFNGFAWPALVWFSWATPRQIIEAAAYALQEGLRDESLMFMVEDSRFSILMARFGLLSGFEPRTKDKRKIYERRKW